MNARDEPRTAGSSELWNLRLYVAGMTPTARRALENLRQLCEERLAGRYAIEVIDLLEQPKLAVDEQIVAVPTLIRELPPPLRKLIGDLSDTAETLVGLQLEPALESDNGRRSRS